MNVMLVPWGTGKKDMKDLNTWMSRPDMADPRLKMWFPLCFADDF